MPGTKLRFDPDSEGRLLHALVNLKQMRMCFAHADPDDFRGAFCRKQADRIHGKKKTHRTGFRSLFSAASVQYLRAHRRKTRASDGFEPDPSNAFREYVDQDRQASGAL